MKAREWLVERSLAKPGRGKFSKEAHLALSKAVASGVTFSDWPKEATGPSAPKRTASVPESKTTDKPAENSVKVETPGESQYLTPDSYRFPEAEYVAKAKVGGKVYSLRECCNTCRVSLVNHACETPSILGNIAVTITRR